MATIRHPYGIRKRKDTSLMKLMIDIQNHDIVFSKAVVDYAEAGKNYRKQLTRTNSEIYRKARRELADAAKIKKAKAALYISAQSLGFK